MVESLGVTIRKLVKQFGSDKFLETMFIRKIFFLRYLCVDKLLCRNFERVRGLPAAFIVVYWDTLISEIARKTKLTFESQQQERN